MSNYPDDAARYKYEIGKLFAAQFMGNLAGRCDINITCPLSLSVDEIMTPATRIHVSVGDIFESLAEVLTNWKYSDE